MSRVLVGQLFTKKHMAKMPGAVRTNDLGPPTICIRNARDSAFDFIIECRPAAPAVKLVSGFVQRGIALTTDVSALVLCVGVLSCERLFGSFVQYYMLLKVGQFIVFGFTGHAGLLRQQGGGR